MLFSIVVNFLFGIIVEHENIKNDAARKMGVLTFSVLANLGILFHYKYTGFLVENINYLIDAVGAQPLAVPSIALPIGISFFTFQSLSYVVDVYRGSVPAQREFTKLALYISFFPQLIAGPIVRYADIRHFLSDREVSFEGFINGLRRFICGLGKKVLLANLAAETADKVFNAGIEDISCSIAWIGIVCYSLQIYFDFSGYSDMAIGLGKMFGFKFLENFQHPYVSKSITEFWRRWHISLSSWFKDYLYIPLGGNRKSKGRSYLNLLIVFFLTGFWHGAKWNFIVWGLFHGFFLILEKSGIFVRISAIAARHSWGGRISGSIYVLLIVMFGWVLFRSETLSYALSYMGLMIGLHRPGTIPLGLGYYADSITYGVICLGAIFSTNLYERLFPEEGISAMRSLLRDAYLAGVLFLCLLQLASSAYNPFIYFRF